MTADFSPGDRCGEWVLESHIGDGAFGSTWRAHDALGRVAAIKFLGEPPGDELRALARLAHPAVPALYEAAASPRPYLAMELAAGRSLKQMLRHGRAPERAALQLVAVLADGLAEVHRADLSHGDIKPENIHVDRISDLRIWIVDFGAAGDGTVGTAQYAAPERLRGAMSSPESDVYSVGLVLFELLHGTLPDLQDGLSAALMRRRHAAPTITMGAVWVRELLGRMLAPQPELRPTAAQVADTMEAHGFKLPALTGSLLRRRARAVDVPPAGLADFLSDWLSTPGAASVVGASGMGRSHTLRAVSTELQARGATWVQLGGSQVAWQAVEEVLSCSALAGAPRELQPEPDVGLRARIAAKAIRSRVEGHLYVLVDDFDLAHPTVQQTARSLAELPDVHLLATSSQPVDGAARQFDLHPMLPEALSQLVSRVLADPSPVDELVDRLEDACDNRPGEAIEILARACDQQVLVRNSRRWHVHRAQLTDMVAELEAAGGVSIETSSQEVADLGALIALFGGPVTREQLAAVSPLPRTRFGQAVQELLDRGLVSMADGRRLTVNGVRTARALEASAFDLPDLHARVLQGAADDFSPLRRLHHLVGAQDLRLTTQQAVELLRDSIQLDPEQAGQLASTLWSTTPVPAVGGAVLEALLAGGRSDDARTIGEQLVAGPRPTRSALAAMGRYYIHVADDADRALPLLSRAMDLAHDSGGLDLTLLLAQAHFQRHAYDQCIEVARAGCTRDPGTDRREQEAWVSLHGTWAQALHEQGELDTAIGILEGVPADVAAGRVCHSLLKGILGRLYWYAGRVREAGEALEAGATDTQLPTLQRARLLNNAGAASYSCGDRRVALERWEFALELFIQLRSVLDQVRVRNNLCVGYTEAGRWERARQSGEQAYENAVERDIHVYAAMSAGNLGDLHAARNDLDEASRWYDTAQSIADAHGIEGEKVELARRRAEVAVRQRAPDADLNARIAESLAHQAGDQMELTRAQVLLLVCEARRPGAGSDLRSRMDDIIDQLKAKGLTGHIADARAWSAEILLELNDPKEALRRIEAVANYAAEHGHLPLRQRAEGLRERAEALVQRDPERSKFERMLSLATRVAREQEPERLLDAIASAGLELLDGERCFVLLMEGRVPQVVRALGLKGPLDAGAAPPSRSIMDQVIAQKRPVIANDIMERIDLREARSVALMALRSAMCVPMADGNDLLGLIYVDSTQASEEELGDGTHLMEALASHAAVAIGHARHREALERRAARAAELVHDLRSPLAAAQSILAEMLDDADAMGSETQVHREAIELLERSMRLAERVLSGSDDKAPIAVDVGRRIEQLGQQLDRYAQRKGRSVFTAVAPGLRILAQPDEFDRVLRNLVGNATRFTPVGGSVRVDANACPEGVRIDVSDSGDGIPEELLPHLFESGVKGSGKQSQHGLGLAIVQRLVHEMGGSIRASNVRDAGACFTIVLPAIASGSQQQAG